MAPKLAGGALRLSALCTNDYNIMHPMANLLCLVAFDSEAQSGQSRITSTSKEPVNYNINFDGMDLLHRPIPAAIERFDLYRRL